jgi:hypothetical protein
MKGLGMLLKSFGVNVAPEHITAIQNIIPEVPARLQQAVAFLNELGKFAKENVAALLDGQKRLEKQNAEIIALLKEHNARRTNDAGNASDGRNG